MKLKLITPPGVEPVTLDQARQHLRIDDDITSDDDLIEALISAAREHAEHITGRSFITRTLEAALDSFTGARIKLLNGPCALLLQLLLLGRMALKLPYRVAFML
jgi:uncharacterized phiE125 gp8 family phage protein